MSTYAELLDTYKRMRAADAPRNPSVEVVGWVHYDSVPSEGLNCIGGWGGCIEQGDRWKDYLETWDEDDVPFVESLRNEILRLKLKQGGDWHQNDAEGVPVFNDGSAGMFSFRAWGDLMAAIWAEHEDRDYSYMDFYMDSCIPGDC